MRNLLLAAALAVCALRAQPAIPPSPIVSEDIEYAATPERKLTLDVYRSKRPRAAQLPLVVWIHGGGWLNGSKDNPRQVLGLIERGYVVASINYRLSGDAIFPAQIHDCKAAIRWLRAHAGEYGIDPRRVGVAGSSAGGHLVALLGTSGGVKDLEGTVGGNLDQSSRVQAVADLFGPTDFVQMDAHSISERIVHDSPGSPESLLIGAPIQENKDKVARANPITYVTPDDPPFLIIHGDKDPLVPFNQSELLLAALRMAGVKSSLHKVVGGMHGQGGEFGTKPLFERIAKFFDDNL